MKTLLRFFALFLFVAAIGPAAAFSSGPKIPASDMPDIALVPVGPSAEVLNFRGPVGIQYELRVANPSKNQLVLKRLDLRTEGRGAYSLRTGAQPLSQQIAPGGLTTIKLSVWGVAHGGFISQAEPVTIRGVAYFSGPSGDFTKVFVQTVPAG